MTTCSWQLYVVDTDREALMEALAIYGAVCRKRMRDNIGDPWEVQKNKRHEKVMQSLMSQLRREPVSPSDTYIPEGRDTRLRAEALAELLKFKPYTASEMPGAPKLPNDDPNGGPGFR